MLNKTMAAAAVAAVVAGTALPTAWAQTPPAAGKKEPLVARILQLQQHDIELMAGQLTERPALLMQQQVRPAVAALPAGKREAVDRQIAADVKKYIDEAVPLVRDRAVKLTPSTIGAMLSERFTEDELKQLIALLESPVVRKFQASMPDMQRALGEKLVAETRGDVEGKLRALEQSIGMQLAAATPAPAGTPSKPAKPAAAASARK